MLTISYGDYCEDIVGIESSSSSFAACVATLANPSIGVRPHMPQASPRTQLLLAGAYAAGVGASREIISLPAPLILRLYDVDTGEPLEALGDEPAVVLALDQATVSSCEQFQLGGVRYELKVSQFIDTPDDCAVSTLISLKRVGAVTGSHRLRLDYGVDSSALNEYLGACDWLTARHYDVGQSILDEASFSVIVDTAEQRLRYDVRIEHFDSPARSVVSWRQRQEGCVASVTLDFATVSQHRLATHWRVGIDGEGNTPDACSCDLNVAGVQSSHLSRWSRIWNEPYVAKALIDYRYNALQRALEFASASGFSGARFPEASNDLGRENGPHYVLSYPDQDIRREWSVDEVLHISADVCYAVNQYWKVTDDDTFMASRGFEMLVESARFAASVFQWSEGKQAYVVNSVMGPDEYHYHVNNSFFTNYMLRWCIRLALSLCDRPRFPGLPEAERCRWQSIAGNVYLPWITVGGVSIPEEFEGYAVLPDTRLRI